MIEHWLKSFHGDSVEDFVAFFWQSILSHLFPHKHDREKIVEVSSKISLLQLQFDEISTKIWTKIRRFCFGKILWQNEETFRQNARGDILPCGKTFCHKKKRFSFVKDFVASTRAPKKF